MKMVSRLTQMLKDVKRFKPPDGACLSPAGEYNLRWRRRGRSFNDAMSLLDLFAWIAGGVMAELTTYTTSKLTIK